MRSMPAGRFLPGKSIIHRIDARVKLLCFFALLAAVVAAKTLWGYAFVIAVVAAVVFASRMPIGPALAQVRSLWTFFIVIFLMNMLFYSAGDAVWSWWIFSLSFSGAAQGANVVLRVALLIILSGVLTATTSPLDITGALGSLMRPLRLLRVPVDDVAMIISVAIQFIPTLLEETDAIKKAQTARGARFESRRLREKAASVLPLVVPTFLAAFRRADELSLAMEARGYRSAGERTKRAAGHFRVGEFTALTVCAAICAFQFCLLG